MNNDIVIQLIYALVNYLFVNAARELSQRMGWVIDGKAVLTLAMFTAGALVVVYEAASKNLSGDSTQWLQLSARILLAWLGSIGVAVGVKKLAGQ